MEAKWEQFLWVLNNPEQFPNDSLQVYYGLGEENLCNITLCLMTIKMPIGLVPYGHA